MGREDGVRVKKDGLAQEKSVRVRSLKRGGADGTTQDQRRCLVPHSGYQRIVHGLRDIERPFLATHEETKEPQVVENVLLIEFEGASCVGFVNRRRRAVEAMKIGAFGE